MLYIFRLTFSCKYKYILQTSNYFAKKKKIIVFAKTQDYQDDRGCKNEKTLTEVRVKIFKTFLRSINGILCKYTD